MYLHSTYKTIYKTILSIVLVACICMQSHAQWETVYFNNNNLPDLEAVAFTTPEYGLAVGADGVILRTEDAGRTWTETISGASQYNFVDVQFVNTTSAFAIGRTSGGACQSGDTGLIAFTKNFGATWELTETAVNIDAIHFPTSNVGYAVGNCGAVYKTTDAGQNWNTIQTDPFFVTTDLRTVHFLNEDIGFIAGDGNVFLKTINGGLTWTEILLPGGNEYEDIFITPSGNGYLLSESVLFYAADSENDSWSLLNLPSDIVAPSKLFFVNNQEGYILGKFNNAGRIWKTINGAGDWDIQQAGMPSTGEFGNEVNGVFFLNQDVGFAVGDNQFFKTSTGGESLTDIQFVAGNVIHDLSENCAFDIGEPGLEGWLIEAINGTNKVYTTSNELGDFFFELELDNYDLNVIAPNTNWNASCDSYNFTLSNPFDTLQLNIPVQKALECPVLSVDVSTSRLLHCADNEYIIRYCNNGTATAIAPYVELSLHEDLSLNASSINGTLIGGNTYRFDLDDVALGDCGVFYITAFLDCDQALVGQTHSVEAHIYPDLFCDDPSWPGPTLKADAVCEGDSVTFTVTNEGQSALTQSGGIIIIEDVILLQTPDIGNLGPEEDTSFVFYPNGKTLRLELTQDPDHPGEKKQAVTIEGCSTNNNGDISIGYVTQYPEHDGNPFISIDCQESTTTTNAAMKKAYPKGYGVERYTEANIDLDYHINFQNTGTDTVYTVIVQDTLSDWLDASSIRPGTASHLYDFSLSGQGTVRFVISDVQIPPASVNEAASKGFVKFRVSQVADNPPGTLIPNNAAVIFDYGTATGTNETTHLIEADFVVPAPPVALGGIIETEEGEGVNAVQMSLTYASDNVATDSSGTYTFEQLSTDSAYLVSPTKNTNILNGVDAMDLYLISQHIVGNEALGSPYKMIAADVNRSATITTMDILHLQSAILLLDTVFPNNQSWRFVESHYTFPNPVDPLAGNIPESFLLNNPDTDNQIHFTGIKIGDVDDTANPLSLLTDNNDENVEETLDLLIDDVQLQQGNYYDIPVYVNNTADLLAYQFAIDFDTEALEYIDLQVDAATNLRSDNFGFSFLELGVITVCWFDQSTQETTNSTNSADGKSLLFNLRFLAKKGTKLSNLLALKGDFVSSRAYERKGELEEKRGKLIPTISFNSLDQYQQIIDHSALEIFPNPTNDVLWMQYEVELESYIEINVLNALGQTVKTINFKERSTKGTYKLNTSDFPEGTYFIHFQANEKSMIRKIVKLR